MEKEKTDREKGDKKAKTKAKKPTASAATKAIHKRKPVSKDFSGVVRFIGKDMDGYLKIPEALRRVKGVSHSLANALAQIIEKELGVPQSTLVGDLTEQQATGIENIAKNPGVHGIPQFMFNRQLDLDTGEDKHLLGVELDFQTRQDIERQKTIRSWVGWRHSIGQKVRGQRTRTTGRKGLAIGVVRKAIMRTAAPAKEESKEKK